MLFLVNLIQFYIFQFTYHFLIEYLSNFCCLMNISFSIVFLAKKSWCCYELLIEVAAIAATILTFNWDKCGLTTLSQFINISEQHFTIMLSSYIFQVLVNFNRNLICHHSMTYNLIPRALEGCANPRGIFMCSLDYIEQNSYLTISIRLVW